MKNKAIIILVIFLWGPPYFAQEEPTKKEDIELTQNQKGILKRRSEIDKLLKTIQFQYDNIKKDYTAAKNETEVLKKEYDYKTTVLKNALKVASKSKKFEKNTLKKAKDLQRAAVTAGKKYIYINGIANLTAALKIIAQHPVISLNITPRTISSTFKKMTFDIDTFSISQSGITGWNVDVFMNNKGGKPIKMKSWFGKGSPPKKLEWDGKEKGEFLLDSASDYYIEATATDVKKQRGTSGKIEFKTDIFARMVEGKGLQIDLTAIKFTPNAANISNQYNFVIMRTYEFLMKFPEYKIYVEGHSDYTMNTIYNKKLSEVRAQAVVKKLVGFGLSKNRIKSFGIGEAKPKSIYYSKKDLNRRVVFILIKDKEAEETYKDYYNAIDFTKEIVMKKLKE